ncbi:MAG TPA: amino acid deaminase/aldolase [Nocardioidaceae bacterium]|nr:amino acid deaminase/aldolase [Nocardioidaceae bacterium]
MAADRDHDPGTQHARLQAATEHLDAPLAVVDLDAFDANAADLVRRAAGTPIRLASKSVRSRALIDRALATPGFCGVMAFTLAEALWLAADIEDVLLAYPTAERAALRTLAKSPKLAARISLMVDSTEQLDLIDSVLPAQRPDLRICLDLDASLRALGGRLHLGPRRSPLHDVESAVALAREVTARPGFKLAGLMAYEGQVAGQADRPLGKSWAAPGIAAMKLLSVHQIAARRAEVVNAVREVAELEFVNGGGTGSIETTIKEDVVTEVAAGSGLFAPALFDGYRRFTTAPAAFFGLDVTRRPAPGIVTVAGGGWIASGPAGPDRLPLPTYPAGLSLISIEGAGEVQTPLTGTAADGLKLGERVWFRHAKAGELCERADVLHLVSGDVVVETVPTYRGEGHAFM